MTKNRQPKEIKFADNTDTTYVIYPDGKVINTSTGRVMKTHVDGSGYWYVTIYKNGVRYKPRIHRLVGELFLGKRRSNEIYNHKDCNKNNNDESNLEIISYSKNTKHWYDNREVCATHRKANEESKMTFDVISESVDIELI